VVSPNMNKDLGVISGGKRKCFRKEGWEIAWGARSQVKGGSHGNRFMNFFGIELDVFCG